MKPYLRRIILCLLPVLIAAGVVAWASAQYEKGKGGFRLGVDLVGGTILVYEVDASKMPQDFQPEYLAAALKRRIDPADLYNVTIRPVAGNPPRVEIILPTGGRHQTEAEKAAWDNLINAARQQYPIEGNPDAYGDIRPGQVAALTNAIRDSHPKVDVKEISAFIDSRYDIARGQRALSTEEVENIKNLIAQQGRLEFRILANTTDDNEAIQRAEAWLKDPTHVEELRKRAILGEPPPPPRNESGGYNFTITINNDTTSNSYSWVEVGKQELYSLGLNSEALARNPTLEQQVRDARAKHIAFQVPRMQGCILYTRDIPNLDRVPPRDRELKKTVEFFVLTRDPERGREVTGDDLLSATPGRDDNGDLAVHFTLKGDGINRFADLTSRNKPTGQFFRHLAVILDGQVRSAPVLRSAITGGRGQISGGTFTPKEIDDLVTILRSGALPATLKPNPVSENSMGPTLGEDTIRKGTQAVLWAFVAVMVFMIFYYRFAGIVACVALMANLLLTVAFMVLVKATFTLPGLAGLVLMLGMAVDANVLIYERLREERERGASLALAIRNGYDRAFPTIIDTHLSSIFTAIVLYIVGNDQLKGFGISLTVGLIISLFTSLYMTRTLFDLWQARGWLNRLNFLHIFSRVPHIDFMAIRYYWFTATILLTILGASLFIYRLDKGGLNIDFMGGTAYTGRLKADAPMSLEELRDRLETGDTLPALSIEQIFTNEDKGSDKSHFFTVRTEEKDRQKVLDFVNSRLKDELQRIEMKTPQIEEQKGQAARATFTFVQPGTDKPDYASPAQVTRLLEEAFKEHGLDVTQFSLQPSNPDPNGQGRYSSMKLELSDPVNAAKFKASLASIKLAFENSPQPERLENFDSQLAANTRERALYAILASWGAILLYLWFRFGNWTFGLATVLCLIHDLFFTLGVIAGAHYLHGTLIGKWLLLQDFKIDLPAVAALLTLVGYSVNDTIVVFDRIREVRGKNPLLTPQMINDSVNQTLSRTVLSSVTVWLVVFVLYVAGGEGVHLFAFVMLVGVVVGTYSSIYIASPLLLIFGEGAPTRGTDRARTLQPAPARG